MSVNGTTLLCTAAYIMNWLSGSSKTKSGGVAAVVALNAIAQIYRREKETSLESFAMRILPFAALFLASSKGGKIKTIALSTALFVSIIQLITLDPKQRSIKSTEKHSITSSILGIGKTAIAVIIPESLAKKLLFTNGILNVLFK